MSSSKRPKSRKAPARAAGGGGSRKAGTARPSTTRSRKGATAAPSRTTRKPAKQAARPAARTKATRKPPSPPPAPARPVQPPAPQAPQAPPARRSIRLAGSASASRLTIKPGPPQGPRAQLELSTRPRPSGPRKLSDVDLEEDEVLIDAFDAVLEGRTVRITAMLERTCVYVDAAGERKLARKTDLWVEADKLPIRRRGLG